MWVIAIIPFILQAIVIIFDEGYFHIRRGLPKWERIGHPIDTGSVLLCMGFVLFVPFSSKSLIIYTILASISSILVTKDEFVHKEHCAGAEHWLHALLFTLHPITLIMAGLIWPVVQQVEVPYWIAYFLNHEKALHQFLIGQFVTMSLFLIYQIVFWNFIWQDKPVLRE
jgi:hypothetical protein